MQRPYLVKQNHNLLSELLEKTDKNQRDNLLIAAKRWNNKKLGKKIVEFNKALSGFRNKKGDVVFLHEEDIEKKIASFLE